MTRSPPSRSLKVVPAPSPRPTIHPRLNASIPSIEWLSLLLLLLLLLLYWLFHIISYHFILFRVWLRLVEACWSGHEMRLKKSGNADWAESPVSLCGGGGGRGGGGRGGGGGARGAGVTGGGATLAPSARESSVIDGESMTLFVN